MIDFSKDYDSQKIGEVSMYYFKDFISNGDCILLEGEESVGDAGVSYSNCIYIFSAQTAKKIAEILLRWAKSN